MGNLIYAVPVPGSTLNSVADPQIATALNTILTWANGNIDAINLSALLAQAAGVNQASQTVKGTSIIATSQSASSGSFATLATPDQVTGVVLASGGLIRVWYQATWQESVASAARAAIFVGSTEIVSATATAASTGSVPAVIGGNPATAVPLSSYAGGLKSVAATSGYSGDVTTGQIIGTATGSSGSGVGGSCDIFAAAGTYTISVQFSASSGSVTVSNRRLLVEAISFA